MTVAVAADAVTKFYGDFPALRGVTLELQPGACLALLGRNGAGKTTLLKIFAGVLAPSSGEVRIFGLPPRQAVARRRMGVLTHGLGLYEDLSALENLLLFARLYGVQNGRAVAHEWLERTGLGRFRASLVREFSRGMKQRLAVARAFLHGPDLLLLDEPFTSLDDRAVALLQDLLCRAVRDGKTIVLSTHQIREAIELASHVALMVRGQLAYCGERPAAMAEDPGWLYRQYGD